MDLIPNEYVEATLKANPEELKELQRLRKQMTHYNFILAWLKHDHNKLIKKIIGGFN